MDVNQIFLIKYYLVSLPKAIHLLQVEAPTLLDVDFLMNFYFRILIFYRLFVAGEPNI